MVNLHSSIVSDTSHFCWYSYRWGHWLFFSFLLINLIRFVRRSAWPEAPIANCHCRSGHIGIWILADAVFHIDSVLDDINFWILCWTDRIHFNCRYFRLFFFITICILINANSSGLICPCSDTYDMLCIFGRRDGRTPFANSSSRHLFGHSNSGFRSGWIPCSGICFCGNYRIIIIIILHHQSCSLVDCFHCDRCRARIIAIVLFLRSL